MDVRGARRIVTTAWVLAALSLGGCFKSKGDVVLEADGSGVITLEHTVDMTVVEKLVATYKAAMGAGLESDGEVEVPGKDQFERYMNPASLKKSLEGKKGVELLSAERADDPEKRTQTMRMKVKFASLEDFYRSGIEPGVEAQLLRGENGRVTLRHTLTRPGTLLTGRARKEALAQAAWVERLLKPFLKDFQVDVKIRAPSALLETNGTKDEAGTGASWTATLASLEKQDALLNAVTWTTATPLPAWKPFHLRVDAKGKVSDVVTESEPPAPAAVPDGAAPPAPVEGAEPTAPRGTDAPAAPAVPGAPAPAPPPAPPGPAGGTGPAREPAPPPREPK